MINKEDFYFLERKPSTLPDDNRCVVVIGGGKEKGLCPGRGVWTTDILLPEGLVIEGVEIQISKNNKEETIMLGKGAGEYAGFLDDATLKKLRFLVKLRNK